MGNKYTDDELLPLSAIQHYAFCERQWGLIHLERQWQENLGTAEGRILHDKVHDSEYTESRGGIIYVRALPLKSYQLGLWGVADMVEFHPLADPGQTKGTPLPGRSGRYLPIPVEYKRGRPKKDDRDAVQLCSQAICLEEMLEVELDKGYLYYGQTQHRSEIVFDQRLRLRVRELSKDMHHCFESGQTPPARKGVKCNLCSLEDVCIPRLTRQKKSIQQYLKEQLEDY